MNGPLQTTFKAGGKEFLTNHWSPTTVYKHLPTIGKYFAVPISMVISSGNMEGFKETLPTALLYLFDQMEENDVMALFGLILNETYANSKRVPDHFDEIFRENPAACLQVVAKVLEVNYGNFFSKEGLSDLLEIVAPMSQAEELYPQQ